ncbi:MAG: hypothetical protein NT159_07425 [Proteobacteria bacterium]|nr:hypothetical protein [Pseudomonadota bacterium]
MLRVADTDQIRLTADELKNFRRATGRQGPPTTIAAYNRELQNSADAWREATTGEDGETDPAANLLARLLEFQKIPA